MSYTTPVQFIRNRVTRIIYYLFKQRVYETEPVVCLKAKFVIIFRIIHRSEYIKLDGFSLAK